MTPSLDFEWDDAKAQRNRTKHGIPFGEAVAVFADAQRADFDVSRLQDGEARRKVIGVIGGRLFTVVYTVRGDTYRLISARPANPQEIRRYGDRQLHP